MILAAAMVGAVVAVGNVGRACEPAESKIAVAHLVKDGELMFSMDHAEMVVAMRLTVNGSAHVAITDSQVNAATGEVNLAYTVVQNADRLVRCQKQIELTWRISQPLKGTEKFKAAGAVMVLKGEKIKALGGEFLGMVGEERVLPV